MDFHGSWVFDLVPKARVCGCLCCLDCLDWF